MSFVIQATPRWDIPPSVPSIFAQYDRLYMSLGLFLVLLTVPTLFAQAVDPRQIADVGIWVKPLKFQISLALYLVTLALFSVALSESTRRHPGYRLFTRVVAVAVILEMVWLMSAAAIGEPSHFNRSNAVLAAVYPMMGALAVILTAAALVMGIALWRQQTSSALPPVLRAGLAQGLVLTFVLTVAAAGFLSSGEGHLVGGNGSDAEGALLMGWARDGGDLRVAHFFATHAMHFIPAAALVSLGVFGRDRTWPVTIASVAFTAFTLFTLVQALQGKPFLPIL